MAIGSRGREGRRATRPATRPGERGLSLLEVMVVLAIIGLVAVIAAPQLISYLDRSRVDAAKIQVKTLSSIVDLFRIDMGRFPTAEEGLGVLVAAPADGERWRGPYLKSAASLTDPWGNPYLWRPGRSGGPGAVLSLGADGQEGGEGLAADIRG